MTNSFSEAQKQKLNFLRDNLPVYAKNYIKIRPKKGGFLIPLIYNEAQMMVHNFIENMIQSGQPVRVVICKGRQQGVSTYMASRYLHKAALNFGISVFILAHMTDSTNYLFDMVKRMYNNLPPPLQPQTERSNRKELRFAASNSEYALGTAGSKEIGRGTNPTHLHGSEAAFWDNTDELAAGLMQAVAAELGTEIVLESTANGVGNMFYNLAMTGLDPNALSRFRTLFIPWYIQKEYQETPPSSYSFHITREEEELMQKYPLTKSHLFWRRRKIEDDFKGRVEKFKQEYPMCLQEAFQTTGDKLLTLSLIETARKYTQGHDLYAPLILGVDGAGQGTDQTAWVLRQGRRIVAWKVYDEPVMPMRLAGIIAGLIDSYKIDMTFLDTAYGFGCRDRLQEMGYGAKTMAIHFGSEALMPELYRNKRAQMYGFMKDWFEDGGVNIPDDEIFVRDLLMIPGFRTSGSRGLLILPPKEEIRADNEGRSPNCFVKDTLVDTPDGSIPIQDLREGDVVCTPFATRTIIKTHKVTTTKLTRVVFSNGEELIGTPNHKIFSFNGGFCRLDELSLTNGIETGGKWRRFLWRLNKKLYMKTKYIDFKTRANTIVPTINISRKDFCTGISIHSVMGRSQKGNTSITKTVFQQITGLRIWKWWTQKNIVNIICENVLKTRSIVSKIVNSLIRFDLLPVSGMLPKKEGNGIVSMENDHGETENRWKLPALCAGVNMTHTARALVNFVHARVNKKKNIGGIKRQKLFVKNAGKNLFLINTGIKNAVPVSVQTYDVEETDVYNITLDKDNVYYANTILSNNCSDALALTFAFPIQARAQRSNLAVSSPDVVRARSPFKSRRLAQAHVRPSRPSEIYVGPSHGRE